MKKLIALLFLMFFTSACTNEKAAVLFNNNPITAQNVMNYSQVFAPNQRIYYIVIIPEKIETRNIDIQIIKKDNKDERFGYTLYWTYSARLKDDQIYYYDDYVVISEPGAYVMKVFSKDKPTKTLCLGEFFVRN